MGVVSAFVKTIEYTGDVRTFNIGSGRGVSLNELVEVIDFSTREKAARVLRHALVRRVVVRRLRDVRVGSR